MPSTGARLGRDTQEVRPRCLTLSSKLRCRVQLRAHAILSFWIGGVSVGATRTVSFHVERTVQCWGPRRLCARTGTEPPRPFLVATSWIRGPSVGFQEARHAPPRPSPPGRHEPATRGGFMATQVMIFGGGRRRRSVSRRPAPSRMTPEFSAVRRAEHPRPPAPAC